MRPTFSGVTGHGGSVGGGGGGVLFKHPHGTISQRFLSTCLCTLVGGASVDD